MTRLRDRPRTVVPSKADAALAAAASKALGRTRGALRMRLEDGKVLTLPRSVARLLSHLLAEMSHGNAVTMMPTHAELTTQEAADYLSVSRPYLVGLLEAGKISFHKVGTHRRVKLGDLENFRKQSEARSSKALDALAAEAQELGLGY